MHGCGFLRTKPIAATKDLVRVRCLWQVGWSQSGKISNCGQALLESSPWKKLQAWHRTPCTFYCLSCFYQGIQRVCGPWKHRSLNRKIEKKWTIPPLSKSAIAQHIYCPFLCPVHGSMQLVLLCATKGGSKRSRFHVSCFTLVGFSGCHSELPPWHSPKCWAGRTALWWPPRPIAW